MQIEPLTEKEEEEFKRLGRYDLLTSSSQTGQADFEDYAIPSKVGHPGVKHSQGKPRYSLIPSNALNEVVKVLTFGAEKYSEDNWKKVPNLQREYSDAAGRHRFGSTQEFLDGESGLPHLAHEICCLMFRLQDQLEDLEDDS
jgi:hypothetical protein